MKNFQDSKKKMMRINSRKDSQKCHVMTDKITKSWIWLLKKTILKFLLKKPPMMDKKTDEKILKRFQKEKST